MTAENPDPTVRKDPGAFARHAPQNFVGEDAERLEAFFASPPPERPLNLTGLIFLPDPD